MKRLLPLLLVGLLLVGQTTQTTVPGQELYKQALNILNVLLPIMIVLILLVVLILQPVRIFRGLVEKILE